MFTVMEPTRESVFTERREAADHSLARVPFVYEREAIKASLPLAGGRKVPRCALS